METWEYDFGQDRMAHKDTCGQLQLLCWGFMADHKVLGLKTCCFCWCGLVVLPCLAWIYKLLTQIIFSFLLAQPSALWVVSWFWCCNLQVVRHLIRAGHDVHMVTGAPDFVFTSEIQSPRLLFRKVG